MVDVLSQLADQPSSVARSIEDQVLSASQSVDRGSLKLYRLKDEVRRDLIRERGLEILFGGLRRADMDRFEHLFEDLVNGARLDNEQITSHGPELVIRVIRILNDPKLPSETKIKSIARAARRREALQIVANGIFVGRVEELADVRDFLIESRSHRILQVHGVAGAGKTTLIRKALLDVIDDRLAIVVEVDFERPVNIENLIPFVGRELLYAIYDHGLIDERRFSVLQTKVDDARDASTLTRLFKREMEGFADLGGRIHFFFDSVEIFINAFVDSVPLMELAETLVEDLEGCYVLLATRLSTFEFKVEPKTIHLNPLSDIQVRQFCRESKLSPTAAQFVSRTIPERNPLILTLMVEAVKQQKSISLEDLRGGPWNDVLFQSYVIERIIAKLPNFVHREVATAALPLRRITAEMLSDFSVFREAGRYLERPATNVFNALRQQVLFFETNDDTIYLRQDIRDLLLRIGKVTPQKSRFDTIRREALDYFKDKATHGDESARTEALYYALCLNSERPLLEDLWVGGHAASELLKYLGDFTPRSRSWLKHKTQRRWKHADFREAFIEDAEFEGIGFVFGAFNTGRVDAIEKLRKTNRVFQSSSYSAVFADAMEDLAKLRYRDAIDKISLSAMRAPEHARHAILQQGLRIAALSDTSSGDLIDLATRFRFQLEKERKDPWLASYYSLWIARLVPEKGALRDEVFRFKQKISNVQPRNIVKQSKLSDVQVSDICLLASSEDPSFAVLWLQAIDPKVLKAPSLKHVYDYLLSEHRNLLPNLLVHRVLANEGASVPKMRTLWERALKAYLKVHPSGPSGNVEPLRIAMLIQTSDILVGLLIASIERSSANDVNANLNEVSRLLQRRVSGEGNVSAVVSASVRQLAREGRFYRSILLQPASYEIRRALSNWLKFFRVDGHELIDD